MRKQLALYLTTSAALRSLWDKLPQEDREQLINLLASPLARAAKAESCAARKEEVHEGATS
jgi:ribosomal protein S7